MEKIKWKYDSKNGDWYVTENPPYSNNGMCISRLQRGFYALTRDNTSYTLTFRKLSSAKTVANLLRNG